MCMWLVELNQLTLNIKKSQFMLIGSNSRLRRIDSIVISADGKQLKEAQCFPYLGLIINQNLTWEDHIEHMRNKINKKLGLLRRIHSRSQRPRSFWSAPRIATSGHVQHRKSAIHGLPVTLRMFRVESDKSDWFWSQSIVFTKPFKTGMSLDQARGRDSWCWPKGARPLGTRMRRIKSCLPLSARITFFNSFVLPLFDYGDIIWGDRGNTTLMAELQILHNKAARIILDRVCLFVEGRGSRVTSRGSRVNSRGSRVYGRGSRVTSRGSKNFWQFFWTSSNRNFVFTGVSGFC